MNFECLQDPLVLGNISWLMQKTLSDYDVDIFLLFFLGFSVSDNIYTTSYGITSKSKLTEKIK